MPAQQWTGKAPTTSSTLNFSSNMVAVKKTIPATLPTTIDAKGVMMLQEAVMPTNPARAPLINNSTLGRPKIRQDRNIATRLPKAPDRIVLSMIVGILSVTARALPPLKPNQPTHKRKHPKVAKGKLCPWMGMFLSKRPILGPIIRTAAKATQPPVECTTVDPAKSINPWLASQPVLSPFATPAHIQWPITG